MQEVEQVGVEAILVGGGQAMRCARDVAVRFIPSLSGRFQRVSRTKEAVYRESGEADYDEAGSPKRGEPETERSEDAPENAVTQLSDHRVR